MPEEEGFPGGGDDMQGNVVEVVPRERDLDGTAASAGPSEPSPHLTAKTSRTGVPPGTSTTLPTAARAEFRHKIARVGTLLIPCHDDRLEWGVESCRRHIDFDLRRIDNRFGQNGF